MNAKDLIRGWIAYAKSNGISAAGNKGRAPTVGDVTEFMKRNGFDETVLTGILDQIDTIPASDTEEHNVDDDQVDTWWDQETGPSAYDPDYQDDNDYDDVDDKLHQTTGTTDDTGSEESDNTSNDTESTVGSVRDMEDEGDEDAVSQEVKQQELMSAKRIIKKLTKAQQRQLYRELTNV